MKKKKKGLLYFRTILSITAAACFLFGCGEKTSKEVTDYVTAESEKTAEEVTPDTIAPELMPQISEETATEAATEAEYPEFAKDYSPGFWMTLNDESDLTESIFASDKKDGNLTITLDESNLDRSAEGDYTITASACNSDGREVRADIPIKVRDMSYIDTEDKAMFFAVLVESGDVDEIRDSLWSKELGKKYGVPAEHIKGYRPPAESFPQETQPPAPKPVQEDGYKEDLAQQMFVKVNEYRVQNGVPELTWDDILGGYAATRAVEVTTHFSHVGPDGLKPSERWGVGENLQMNDYYGIEVETAFSAWKNSSGHNANMLNSEYTKTALSCYFRDGICYFVQIFSFE